MAEGSPITDISTDGDTDDKNQRVILLFHSMLYIFFPFCFRICLH